MYKVKMNFEDDVKMEFDCAEDEDLITASLRQDMILMSECRDGLCTSCKVLCETGEYEHGEGVNVQSLPPEEQEEGQILMCQAFPYSDLELEMPYTSDRVTLGVAIPSKTYESKMLSCEKLTENVVKIELQIQDLFGKAEEFPFIAGQYVTIEVPGTTEWRSYSMANVAGDGKIELLIRLLDDGVMSNYLRGAAKAGDSVEVRGPYGTFNLHPAEGRSRYFIAGSTGLAPLLSMVREMNDKGDTTPAHLLLGARNTDFLFYEEEIKQLESSMDSLTVHIALEDIGSRDSESVFCGNSVEMMNDLLAKSNEKPDIYICGPAGMVTAVEVSGKEADIPSKQIYLERFVAS